MNSQLSYFEMQPCHLAMCYYAMYLNQFVSEHCAHTNFLTTVKGLCYPDIKAHWTTCECIEMVNYFYQRASVVRQT